LKGEDRSRNALISYDNERIVGLRLDTEIVEPISNDGCIAKTSWNIDSFNISLKANETELAIGIVVTISLALSERKLIEHIVFVKK